MIGFKKKLWYDNPGPIHFNIARAGHTMFWSGMDNAEAFRKNCQDPIKKHKLKMLGFLDSGCIKYSFNHQGFRCEEFDDRPAGIALGCSFTEGVGLPVEHAWPSVLSGMLGQHIWNLGVGGSAMDTCFRLLDHYIDVLNPKFVVLCQPPAQRLEYFDRYDKTRVFIANHLDLEMYKEFAEEWMANDANTETNCRRNVLAMQFRCNEKNIPFFAFPNHPELPKDANARDLAHPGMVANRVFANKIYNKIKDKVHLTT